jgi:hypothetical protein
VSGLSIDLAGDGRLNRIPSASPLLSAIPKTSPRPARDSKPLALRSRSSKAVCRPSLLWGLSTGCCNIRPWSARAHTYPWWITRLPPTNSQLVRCPGDFETDANNRRGVPRPYEGRDVGAGHVPGSSKLGFAQKESGSSVTLRLGS